MIQITAPFNEARLSGALGFLNTGSGAAQIRIYGGTRPASPLAEPDSPMLAAVPLANPAGSVSGGVLSLVAEDEGLIVSTGIATWARIVNRNGDVAFDCDAGEGSGPWEVQLAQVQLFAGGGVRLLSAVLG